MYEELMRKAVREAEESLREGNNGFGAAVMRGGVFVSCARDSEVTSGDPTAHAEIAAIRSASKALGRDLSGCVLVSTHEPCPMCAFAAVWAGIREIAFGYSIREAISQGRKRIDFSCADVYRRAGAALTLCEGVLHDACAVLYKRDVRAELERLRGADDQALDALNAESEAKRRRWFEEIRETADLSGGPVTAAYRLLLRRFGAQEDELPIVRSSEREIVFHSMNFCPTLEACRILGLDTRHVCRILNERSTQSLIKQIDERLTFSRNYDRLRPYTPYCEERITLM